MFCTVQEGGKIGYSDPSFSHKLEFALMFPLKKMYNSTARVFPPFDPVPNFKTLYLEKI